MKAALALMLLCWPLAQAQDEESEPLPCTFEAHTPVGTLAGECVTQTFRAEGFNVRWKLTLTVDARTAARAAGLQPDRFYDMVRSQSLEDGSFTVVVPLWGDLVLKPLPLEYIQAVGRSAPLYETRPNEITISRSGVAPLTFELQFDERREYFNPALRMPCRDWVVKYLESFYRLGTNRPDGFSR